MKQLFRIAVVLFALLLLSGCGPSSAVAEKTTEQTLSAATDPAAATEPDQRTPAAAAGFEAVYADICRLLDSGSWDLKYAYATMGMVEIASAQETTEERYGSLTYALEDVTGDEAPEMIVLEAMGNTGILGIFELRDGLPVLIREGWSRSRLYRLSDGALYSEGSNGAAYAVFEAYGQLWFTYPKDEDQEQIAFYHAEDGSYDPALAREITADEYEAKQLELSQKITAFSAYPFR